MVQELGGSPAVFDCDFGQENPLMKAQPKPQAISAYLDILRATHRPEGPDDGDLNLDLGPLGKLF